MSNAAVHQLFEQTLRAMFRSNLERQQPEIELQCGESRGPFAIKELGAEASEGENQITVCFGLSIPSTTI